ncbi:hypothetical protein GCM10022419_076390 [Nonomuraea rosea]|uniref:Uncharacterized protein n=1 Tax=Nonomuraea rosea TaxID=638574 RepID=A0ABP6YII6_9ACTN
MCAEPDPSRRGDLAGKRFPECGESSTARFAGEVSTAIGLQTAAARASPVAAARGSAQVAGDRGRAGKGVEKQFEG